jgi:multidrug resistance efflux pump
VRPGDVVREGDLLGSLDDRDLRLERAKWVSQREQLLKQHRQALADRDAARLAIFSASLEEAQAELDRIEDRLARTELRAPFDGVIIAGDLTQQLGAPVDKGAVLFEVAPLDAYRVILRVDETDIDDVQVGQSGALVFTSLPEQTYDLEVEKITPVAVAEEGRNYFQIEAQLAERTTHLRPAMEGVAKIWIARRRLIWIWTHDAVDWLRLAFWRWMP